MGLRKVLSLVVEYLPSISGTLDLISSAEKKKKGKRMICLPGSKDELLISFEGENTFF